MKFSAGYRIASSLLLILISGRSGECGHPCPINNSFLLPCTCTEIPLQEKQMETMRVFDIPTNNSFFTQVECRSLTSFQTMHYILRSGLNRMLIDKLVVHHLLPGKINEAKTETLIRGGLFHNSRILRFEVRNSALDSNFIDLDSPFSGEEHCLVSFSAVNCSLQGTLSYNLSFSVTTKGFSSLSKLEAIDFSQNHIVHIDKTAFQNPPEKLRELNLSRNSIEEIDKGAFAMISALKVLDLSHNVLCNVTRDLFSSPNSMIEIIDLSWNRLEKLPEDLFDGMPLLRVVRMEKNFLFSLAPNPWRTAWDHLTNVYLWGNFIECDCNTAWLLVYKSTTNSTTGGMSTTTAVPTADENYIFGNSTVDLDGDCYVSIKQGNEKRTLLNLELHAALEVLQESCGLGDNS